MVIGWAVFSHLEDLSKHVVEALIRDPESFAGLEVFTYRANIFLGHNCPQETDYTLLSQVEVFIHYLDCRSDLRLYKHKNFCPAEFTTQGDRKAGSFKQTGEHKTVLKDEKWTELWNQHTRCWFVSIDPVHYYFINLLAKRKEFILEGREYLRNPHLGLVSRHSGCLPTIELLWMNTYTSRIEAKIYKENVILSWVYFNILLKLTCCICMPTAPSHNPVTEFQRGGMLCSFTGMASCIRLPHKPSLPVKVPCPKPPPSHAWVLTAVAEVHPVL